MPVDALDIRAMTLQFALLLASNKIKYSHRSIVRARRELGVGRREAQTSDRLRMALEHFHVVHICLPVLDVALVVARDHPLLVSTPDHGSHGTIVSLENGLEVECETVPQGELARTGARHQTTTVGCPLKNENIYFSKRKIKVYNKKKKRSVLRHKISVWDLC